MKVDNIKTTDLKSLRNILLRHKNLLGGLEPSEIKCLECIEAELKRRKENDGG